MLMSLRQRGISVIHGKFLQMMMWDKSWLTGECHVWSGSVQ